MFVQVIQGRTKDPAGLREQFERWRRELMPSAVGFLGSTAGVDENGEFIAIARFESEEAARQNSDKPVQGRWWAETEKYLEGEATFYDCSDVELVLRGGSDDAGFVQVVQGTARDRARLKEVDERFEREVQSVRPDYIGGITAWQGNDFTSINYFTSEQEARQGERKDEMQSFVQEMQSLIDNVKWVDIREPWFVSASG